MTSRRIYYLNYLDPKTGFLKREEANTHRELEERVAELKSQGVKEITKGSFLRT